MPCQGRQRQARIEALVPCIDVSGVIAAGCRNFNVDEKKLANPTKRIKIAHARVPVTHIATRDLPISGSEVDNQGITP
jgi:hypothetical protein